MAKDPDVVRKVDRLDELAMGYETGVIDLYEDDYLTEFYTFYEIKNRNLKLIPSPEGFYEAMNDVSGYTRGEPIAREAERLFGLPKRIMVFEDSRTLVEELGGRWGLGPFFFVFDVMFCEYEGFTLCFLSGTNN